MSAKSYDSTFKTLVEWGPEDWTALTCKRRAPPTTVIDADIATVSGAADKVLHVADTPPYLLHLDFQAGHDSAGLPPLLLQRNVLLHARHRMPVRTVAVPLRPEADSPALTGRLEVALANEEPYIVFRYQVLRVWQLPPDVFLEGGPALFPLATVSNVTERQLPAIINIIKLRMGAATSEYAKLVWAATELVMGLRYNPELIHLLLGDDMGIEESLIYQEILQKGEARGEARGKEIGRAEGLLEEARKLVVKLGRKRLGLPSDAIKTALNGMADLAKIERLIQRLHDVDSWEELLGQPRTPRRKQSD